MRLLHLSNEVAVCTTVPHRGIDVSLDEMFPGTTDRLLLTSSLSPAVKKWLIRPDRDEDGRVIPLTDTPICESKNS